MAGLRLLYVAYPLVPVSEESCGGAEQMLSLLERRTFCRGHHTVVAACAGSRVAGRLLATSVPAAHGDCFEKLETEHVRRVLDHVRSQPVDLVHDKGGSFWRYGREVDVPVLATLHLPRWFYPQDAFNQPPPNLFLNFVSESQAAWFRDVENHLGVVPNGIELERFPYCEQKDGFLLWLGRVWLEKGPHLALDIAYELDLPIVLAGQVYPFPDHQEFFRREVQPRLERAGGKARFVETPSFAEKLELLRRARALLLPTLCDETSSLVSMEAMACGTPVAAFRRGAIPDIVQPGVGGFVADTVEGLKEAVRRMGELSPAECRRRAGCFSAEQMAERYEQLYEMVLGRTMAGAGFSATSA